MGLFDRMFAPTAARASAGTPSYSGLMGSLGSVQSASGMLVSQSTAMGVSTVYSCVNRLATDLARCAPKLYRLNDDGTQDFDVDHPMQRLFAAPNAQQTWFEWAWQMWVGHILRGNSYAAIKRLKGDPWQLIPINPDAVVVMESQDGSILYSTNRIGLWQIAMLAEFPVTLAEEDMLHLRGLTFNSLVGVSTIGLARDAIGLAMGLEQQAARWIGNGARPATWLKTPGRLGDVAANRLKAQFEGLYSGVQNTGKTVVLEEGLEPVALQLTSVDLEFIAQRNLQILEICRMFGVPPHKVGVLDRGTVQNIAQQDQDYVNTAIMQKLVLAEQKFEQVFADDLDGLKVMFDHGELLRADVLTRRNAARLGIISGITTPNEERRAEKLPPKPGGDNLLVPSNTAALGSDASGQPPDAAGRPAGGKTPDPGVGTGGSQPNADNVAEDAPAQN